MDSWLEELRKQRAQIQAHLEWLDQQIAKASGETDHAPKKVSPEKKEAIQATVESPTREEKTDNTEQKTEAEPVAKAPLLPEIDAEAPAYKAQSQQELTRAKIGCFLIFALSTLLFLFALFGLPYFLD